MSWVYVMMIKVWHRQAALGLVSVSNCCYTLTLAHIRRWGKCVELNVISFDAFICIDNLDSDARENTGARNIVE